MLGNLDLLKIKVYSLVINNKLIVALILNLIELIFSIQAYKIHSSGRGHQLKLREQSGETKMHKCPQCEKRFLQESACLYHLETVHRHPSCEADLTRIHKGKDLVTQLYGDHVKQVALLLEKFYFSLTD